MMNNHRQPPRFVPTLTEVIADTEVSQAPAPAQDPTDQVIASGKPKEVPAQAPALTDETIDQIICRIETQLHERLTEIVDDVLDQHANALRQAIATEITHMARGPIQQMITKEVLTCIQTTKS